jgi:hypothetical protein
MPSSHELASKLKLNGTPLGEMEDAVPALPSLGQMPPGVTRCARCQAADMEN